MRFNLIVLVLLNRRNADGNSRTHPSAATAEAASQSHAQPLPVSVDSTTTASEYFVLVSLGLSLAGPKQPPNGSSGSKYIQLKFNIVYLFIGNILKQFTHHQNWWWWSWDSLSLRLLAGNDSRLLREASWDVIPHHILSAHAPGTPAQTMQSSGFQSAQPNTAACVSSPLVNNHNCSN